MRKPRNYDEDLKALANKARKLQDRKVQQLGELVLATGADALASEELAGALLAAAESRDSTVKEGWRAKGAAFFRQARRPAREPASHSAGEPAVASAASSPGSEPGA